MEFPEVHVVISHYNEEVVWCFDIPFNYTIFTKGNMNLSNHTNVIKMSKNKGFEATSYLKYIIDNYDSLPEIICFFQAERVSWHGDDLIYILKRFKWDILKDIPFVNVNKRDKYFRSWILEHPNPRAHGPYKRKIVHRQEIWDSLFTELGDPPPEEEWWCYGCAQFIVSRDSILKNSKHFYENIFEYLQYDLFNGKGMAWGNKYIAVILEHMWFRMFGPNVAIEKKLSKDDFLITNY
jgi:hypothetical protein